MFNPKFNTIHNEAIQSTDDSSAQEKGFNSHDHDWDDAEERALVLELQVAMSFESKSDTSQEEN